MKDDVFYGLAAIHIESRQVGGLQFVVVELVILGVEAMQRLPVTAPIQ